MDYTPITAGRVLVAFVITTVVGLGPVMAIALNHGSAVKNALFSAGGYGGVTLVLGIIAVSVALIRLTRPATATRRRVVGRPSRA